MLTSWFHRGDSSRIAVDKTNYQYEITGLHHSKAITTTTTTITTITTTTTTITMTESLFNQPSLTSLLRLRLVSPKSSGQLEHVFYYPILATVSKQTELLSSEVKENKENNVSTKLTHVVGLKRLAGGNNLLHEHVIGRETGNGSQPAVT